MTVASNIVHKNCQFELPFANFCPESVNFRLKMTIANLYLPIWALNLPFKKKQAYNKHIQN